MQHTEEQMEEWLEKVDKANKLVKDLTSGKISTEEFYLK